jgi:outer membrane protein OmpA-like peptidoglycan-associated protein
MKNKYSVSMFALALTVSAMGTAMAQTTTTESTQDQIQPQVTEPAKEEAAPAAPAATEEPAKQEAAPAAPAATEEPAKQEAAPAAPAATEEPAKQEAAPAAPAATEEPAKQEAAPAAPAATEEPAAQQAAPAVQEDLKPVFTADALLNDARPAAELTDADLRQRIQAAQDLAANEGANAEDKGALIAKAEADTAELNGRIAAATGVTVKAGASEDEAAKIIGDTRASAELDDDALRERIKQSRGVLAAEGLSEATATGLRAVLTNDSKEIRNRVAARGATKKAEAVPSPAEEGKSNELPEAKPGQMTVGDLNRDDRPGSELTTDALQRRIDANKRALTIKELPTEGRSKIEARLEGDRAEFGTRLVDRKQRRKKGLSTGAAIAIGAGVGVLAGALIASRPTITVAEAYDEELEDWLIAPPLVKVKPRYRIEDFAEQPRLRYAVPGIEVDTIRFGFGEGFLREEEVTKLQRIGELIERIVAGSPNEVFLIEGHTDAVGTREANHKLSEERADAVRKALLEYFVIEESNLATVGRGESFLKIPTERAEVENRRVTLRRITPLLKRSAAQ